MLAAIERLFPFLNLFVGLLLREVPARTVINRVLLAILENFAERPVEFLQIFRKVRKVDAKTVSRSSLIECKRFLSVCLSFNLAQRLKESFVAPLFDCRKDIRQPFVFENFGVFESNPHSVSRHDEGLPFLAIVHSIINRIFQNSPCLIDFVQKVAELLIKKLFGLIFVDSTNLDLVLNALPSEDTERNGNNSSHPAAHCPNPFACIVVAAKPNTDNYAQKKEAKKHRPIGKFVSCWLSDHAFKLCCNSNLLNFIRFGELAEVAE